MASVLQHWKRSLTAAWHHSVTTFMGKSPWLKNEAGKSMNGWNPETKHLLQDWATQVSAMAFWNLQISSAVGPNSPEALKLLFSKNKDIQNHTTNLSWVALVHFLWQVFKLVFISFKFSKKVSKEGIGSAFNKSLGQLGGTSERQVKRSSCWT